jgi:hypothetical protein
VTLCPPDSVVTCLVCLTLGPGPHLLQRRALVHAVLRDRSDWRPVLLLLDGEDLRQAVLVQHDRLPRQSRVLEDWEEGD